MKVIFEKNYDSESIVDMSRDISEAFQPEFNSNITPDIDFEEQGVTVLFTVTNTHGITHTVFTRQYSIDDFNDIEEHVSDAFATADEAKLGLNKDEYGFDDGEYHLTFTLN